MATQNGRRSNEAQSKPSLSIPPGARIHHRRLQNFMESSGTASQRWKVESISTSTMRIRWPGRTKISKRYIFKATFGHNYVIFVALGRTSSHPSKVMSVTQPLTEDSNPETKSAKMEIRPTLSFSDKDKVGTIQPHDDVLVVTLKVGGMM